MVFLLYNAVSDFVENSISIANRWKYNFIYLPNNCCLLFQYLTVCVCIAITQGKQAEKRSASGWDVGSYIPVGSLIQVTSADGIGHRSSGKLTPMCMMMVGYVSKSILNKVIKNI